MEHHHPPPLPQQHGDQYRPLVLSPQPDHAHALLYQPQQATPPPPQQHHHPSLASHFHLLHVSRDPPLQKASMFFFWHGSVTQKVVLVPCRANLYAVDFCIINRFVLVTRLGDAIATGTRDQAFDALVEELTSQFARSQQLLNSISGTLSSKSVVLLRCER
ncbi:Mediator of RNA polymerase II transcription subunit 9 [Hordeum vulgare]|nr:Mediator of RNA polymerase II transcription subunit 9 [Hordeum vulgare]